MSTDQAVFTTDVGRSADIDSSAPMVVDRPSRLMEWLLKARSHALVWSVGTAFALFLLTAAQGVLLARLLGPTSRGEYGTAIFYTQLLTFVGLLGTPLSIARRAARGDNTLPELGRSAAWLGCITGIGTMATVSILAWVALPSDKAFLAPLCIAAALFLPTEHVRLSLLAVDHGAARFARYNAHRLLAVATLPLMLLIVWLVGGASLKLLIGLSVAAPLIPLAVRLMTNDYSLRGPVAPPPVTLIREGLPCWLAQLAADTVNRLDGFLVVWLVSLSTQGLYAAAVPAAALLIAAPSTAALFAFNAGATQTSPIPVRKLSATVVGLVGFQALTALTFAAVLAPLVVFVYGEAFRGSVPFALALLPGAALNGCTVVAEGYLQGRGRSVIGIWCRVSAAIVMLAFVGVFYSSWGAISIPWAASAGQAVNALAILAAVFSESGRRGSEGV